MLKHILLLPLVLLGSTIVAVLFTVALLIIFTVALVLSVTLPISLPIWYICGGPAKFKARSENNEKNFAAKVWAWR